MKRIPRKLFSLTLIAIFLISTGVLLSRWFQSNSTEAAYTDAITMAMASTAEPVAAAEPPAEPSTEAFTETEATVPETTQPPEPVWIPAPVEEDPWMEILAQTDLDALRQVNPHVIGWIFIPDTPINYPLLQGENNQFYLEHTWEGTPSRHGSIFMECRNSPDFSNFNTILYGHNMADKTMFGALHNYTRAGYLDQHPYVYVVTDQGVLRYEIISTYSAAIDGMTFRLSFRDNAIREAYLEEVLTLSEIQANVPASTTDRYLTLVTCTGWSYDFRRVVIARLAMVETAQA